ncbi:MAG: ABC transporter permease [Wenzhouxiangellaceae bacterium]|nr:ABC transporter permease [Wenzhouxiangellaceae bacterium]MBS3823670.1 ABC transporter permease [Wenzhouxiangellaceae bacterium]
MRALNRKLLRDLWNLRAQAIAIALVIAGGVATWVISLSTIESLQTSQRMFYQNYRFADVFASLERAPRSTMAPIEQIPGVRAAEGRIRTSATLTVSGFDEPVEALVTSVPESGRGELNRLYLNAGRLPQPGSDVQVVISEAFAEAHDLATGDTVAGIIRGRATRLVITGIGLSPEFVYQIRPGSLFPDHTRYAAIWMHRQSLEQAAGMEGAFNDVVLQLERGANGAAVIERLDSILERYGGTGAFGRDDHTSHSYLSEEMEQLEAMAWIVPLIFLGVAAFLLNIVVHRMVRMQRDQIAILKAFGYRNGAIGLHFTGLVLLIVLLGALPGIALGGWLGHGLASIYREFFRFPELYFHVGPAVIASAAGVTTAAALAGTWRALWQAFRLMPAEAMRPEQPGRFHRSLAERLPLVRRMDQPSRMIVRNLERQPVKAVLAITGIALAAAILVTGRFQQDTIDFMLDVQFGFAAREDLTVTFTEPTGRRALHELQSLSGVIRSEPYRAVAVELVHGHRSHKSAIQAFAADAMLHRTLDADLDPISLPASGLLLTDWLANRLNVKPGQRLEVRVLEGNRRTTEIQVAGIVREFVGASGYMRLDTLNRVLFEADSISGAFLMTETDQRRILFEQLKTRPRVATSSLRENAIASFTRTMGENIRIFSLINTLLAGVVAFGVIYNTARLALSERARELASLRVLGFRKGEIAWVLLGELVLLTLVAIPLGLWIGHGFCNLIGHAMASEFYRVPAIVHGDSYAFATLVVVVAMLISMLAIGRRIARLDLVEVLKTRE